MNVFKKLATSFSFSLLSMHPVVNASQFIDVFDGQFDASQYLSENAYGFLPVPIIITDPAVEGGLGLMGLFFHESDKEKEARLAAMQKSDTYCCLDFFAAKRTGAVVSCALG